MRQFRLLWSETYGQFDPAGGFAVGVLDGAEPDDGVFTAAGAYPADRAFEEIGMRQKMPEVLGKFKKEYESIRGLF
jgi:hypothetical protein